MIVKMTHGRTLPEAYHDALYQLATFGKTVNCPDYNTSRLELAMTMIVDEPIAEPMISRFFIGGPHELEQYRQEMLDGILDFEVERGKWKYTYHSRMTDWGKAHINQRQFVIDDLRRNAESTRAVICIRDNEQDAYSDDPACWQEAQFFIRDNKLDCYVTFRSNDAWEAAYMNAFAIIMLQKSIADELGVEVGTYVHTATSFHCYEKDIEHLRGFAARYAESYGIGNSKLLTYNYAGEWEEYMNDERESIAAMVEEQRKKNRAVFIKRALKWIQRKIKRQ